MSFIEQRFPICPSLGVTSGPTYRVSVSRMQSGVEKRQRHWQYPLHRFLVSVDPRAVDEVQTVLEWWHAMGGAECGFRWKDWGDYKSGRVNEEVTIFDQPLIEQAGSPTSYQLIKQYIVGARVQQRPITKPVSSTIRVANDAGVEQDASRWALDTSTGLLEPGPEFEGVPGAWGGEFDVPVRFEGEELPIVLQNQIVHGTSFVLEELRL